MTNHRIDFGEERITPFHLCTLEANGYGEIPPYSSVEHVHLQSGQYIADIVYHLDEGNTHTPSRVSSGSSDGESTLVRVYVRALVVSTARKSRPGTVLVTVVSSPYEDGSLGYSKVDGLVQRDFGMDGVLVASSSLSLSMATQVALCEQDEVADPYGLALDGQPLSRIWREKVSKIDIQNKVANMTCAVLTHPEDNHPTFLSADEYIATSRGAESMYTPRAYQTAANTASFESLLKEGSLEHTP